MFCRKNGGDDQCLRAQSILHPPCAQTPAQWSGREEDLPSCHNIARTCRHGDKSCRASLERWFIYTLKTNSNPTSLKHPSFQLSKSFPFVRKVFTFCWCCRYEQSCSADPDTKSCAAPFPQCRDAMVEILGTDLRTNCGCAGTAGDFRDLFECIEYQRLFWVNPCVVDAQKDYHINSDIPTDTGGGGQSITPSVRGELKCLQSFVWVLFVTFSRATSASTNRSTTKIPANWATKYKIQTHQTSSNSKAR